MLYYISPGPLCDWCEYCTIQQHRLYHSEPFKAISISPVTGIVFKAYWYSATQLADAFEKIISDHMDFEIKRHALERWNMLIPALLDGPPLRDTEFELQEVFLALDDFLFLRALQHRCRVEWVDECKTGWYRDKAGWSESGEETNLGRVLWIRLVRPTVEKPRSVHSRLCILMHEMCHAVFALKCSCSCCRCPLNEMNGEGFEGHGPSWEKLRRSVENTASLHLEGVLPRRIYLCGPSEREVASEQKQVTKMLSGLYKKITHQGSESAVSKRLERSKRASDQAKLLAEVEEEQTEEERLDALACAATMFKKFERERVFSALDKHVTCLSTLVQEAKPENRSPELIKALDYIETEILKKEKDGGYGTGDHEGKENHNPPLEEEESA